MLLQQKVSKLLSSKGGKGGGVVTYGDFSNVFFFINTENTGMRISAARKYLCILVVVKQAWISCCCKYNRVLELKHSNAVTARAGFLFCFINQRLGCD